MKLIPLIEINNNKLNWVGKYLKTPIKSEYPLIIKDINDILITNNKTYVIMSKINEKTYILDYENTITIEINKKRLENNYIIPKNNGIHIILTGRLKGAIKTTKFVVGEGKFKPLSFNNYLEFISDYILTKWGKYGLKVKIS